MLKVEAEKPTSSLWIATPQNNVIDKEIRFSPKATAPYAATKYNKRLFDFA